jgi:hypothetical protein
MFFSILQKVSTIKYARTSVISIIEFISNYQIIIHGRILVKIQDFDIEILFTKTSFFLFLHIIKDQMID